MSDAAHEYAIVVRFNTYGGKEDSSLEFEELINELHEKFPGWSFEASPMFLYKE